MTTSRKHKLGYPWPSYPDLTSLYCFPPRWHIHGISSPRVQAVERPIGIISPMGSERERNDGTMPEERFGTSVLAWNQPNPGCPEHQALEKGGLHARHSGRHGCYFTWLVARPLPPHSALPLHRTPRVTEKNSCAALTALANGLRCLRSCRPRPPLSPSGPRRATAPVQSWPFTSHWL